MPGELQELEAVPNLVVVHTYLYITKRVAATTSTSYGYAKWRDEFSYYHQHHPSSPHRLYLYLPNYVSLWLAPFPGVINRRVGRTTNQPGPPSTTRGEEYRQEKYNDTQIPMHKFRVRWCCWWRWKSRNETSKIDLVSPHSSGHPELHILEGQAGRQLNTNTFILQRKGMICCFIFIFMALLSPIARFLFSFTHNLCIPFEQSNKLSLPCPRVKW